MLNLNLQERMSNMAEGGKTVTLEKNTITSTIVIIIRICLAVDSSISSSSIA